MHFDLVFLDGDDSSAVLSTVYLAESAACHSIHYMHILVCEHALLGKEIAQLTDLTSNTTHNHNTQAQTCERMSGWWARRKSETTAKLYEIRIVCVESQCIESKKNTNRKHHSGKQKGMKKQMLL